MGFITVVIYAKAFLRTPNSLYTKHSTKKCIYTEVYLIIRVDSQNNTVLAFKFHFIFY